MADFQSCILYFVFLYMILNSTAIALKTTSKFIFFLEDKDLEATGSDLEAT